MANPEDSVVSAIDELERDEIDELVDWQMSQSPAAEAEEDDPVSVLDELMDLVPDAKWSEVFIVNVRPCGQPGAREVLLLGAAGGVVWSGVVRGIRWS